MTRVQTGGSRVTRSIDLPIPNHPLHTGLADNAVSNSRGRHPFRAGKELSYIKNVKKYCWSTTVD